jgi:hypothetical protein
VYGKGFDYKGDIGSPLFVSCQIRHNEMSLATVSIAGDHPRAVDVMTPGSRLTIANADGHLTSGRIHAVNGDGPGRSSRITFTVHDDFEVLKFVLGWVEPTLPINQQGVNAKAYDVRSGPAETVLKQYVVANAISRLGLPLTVAPDQGRGANINASLRFHPLFDRLFPTVDGAGLDRAGIGVFIKQVGAGLVLDVYEVDSVPKVLTEDSGVISSWRWSRAAPTATRVVMAGQEPGPSRVFRTVTDAAREAQWDFVAERVQDARDEEDPAELLVRAAEVLAEGDRKNGLSVTLSETATFRYGKVATVGDLLTIGLPGGVTIGPEVLREVLLSWTRDEGYRAVPQIGELENAGNTVLARSLASVVRYLRHRNLTEG